MIELIQTILLALMQAAPDGTVQRAINRANAELARDYRDNPHAHARHLAAMLYDGLAYGNWPSAP